MSDQPKRYSALALRDGAPRIHPSAKLRNCTLGRFTEVAERVVLNDCALGDYSYIERQSEAIYAVIGKFTAIASNVRLNALEHPIERISQHKMTYRANEYFLRRKLDTAFRDYRQNRKVVIGHDVWIGHGAAIMPDVTIGNGAVVGAGAVVTRDVAPYAIVAGVPAKQLRWRFEPDLASQIEALTWWDWDHDRLATAIEDMAILSAADFVAKYAV